MPAKVVVGVQWGDEGKGKPGQDQRDFEGIVTINEKNMTEKPLS